MAKEKWETISKGIRVKTHPTRKHGVKFDRYFSLRFRFNGVSVNSGLGWGSEGWTLEKAIAKMQELKEEAQAGEGVKTHRAKQVEADELHKERERQEQERQEQEEKDSITLREYFIDIYYPAIKNEKKTKTYTTEEHLFRLWIDPVIGGKSLKTVSTFDIERLKKTVLDAGRAPRTAEYTLTTLGQIYRHAERTGHYEGTIPTSQVKKPRFDNKRVRFLSLDEAHNLLDILRGKSRQVHDMALLSLHCGLRAGEIFSLTWGNVDLEHGLINLMDTKSGRNRTLSITQDVKEMFVAIGPGMNGELVFPDREGKRVVKISKTYTRAVEQAGLNDGITDRRQRVTFHTLRHSFASWLVMDGISLYQIKELLGHASLTMTERYSHLSPDRNRLAAETMGKIFQRKEQAPVKVVNFR
ncbi:MAG: tyrosine-type recombinase/integrase [Desulfobacterium sp.]|nr:tyrosine-type recombinase/integrase [Desulfobacterium sp.]